MKTLHLVIIVAMGIVLVVSSINMAFAQDRIMMGGHTFKIALGPLEQFKSGTPSLDVKCNDG
ncbi:MAG: hypothetical protein KGH99_06665, partial [Thaumarchaeota archaeon]|nr:hypothetical protein [Nitrososphaerota archaeon]